MKFKPAVLSLGKFKPWKVLPLNLPKTNPLVLVP